ncbi:MAG: hypothetical protein EB148_03975, partial [Actinobacteria bacterium]|nr:hypothetical protein [Actinomycetota bacterium]
MTNEFGDNTSPHVELPDPPREGKPSIPPPPGRAFRAPGVERDGATDGGRDVGARDGGARDGGARSSSDTSRNGDGDADGGGDGQAKRSRNRRRRRGGKGRNRGQGRDGGDRGDRNGDRGGGRGDRSRGGRRGGRSEEEIEAELVARRRGKERDGRPLGRYLMCVHVHDDLTQVSVLEGRNLIEHYVSRPADDVSQIHGNIYLGRVQNVLPGMEAAFVDIATPKNAVLYRGDVQFDKDDVVEQGPEPRIEQVLKRGQLILCQVTKNP